MANPADQVRVIQHLRNQVNDLRQERDEFRRLYEAELVENRQLARIRQNLRTNYQRCIDQNNRLKERVQDLKKILSKHDPKLYRKGWEEICPQTRRKRKIEYREIFDRSLETVPECKKAKVELRLGNDKIKFTWSKNHMAQCRASARRRGFTVYDPESDGSDNEYDEEGIDDRSPERLKQEIIHVMDRFRISQEAYDELQKTLKKLPLVPMHHLKKQKKKMSEEIPYTIPFPDVS